MTSHVDLLDLGCWNSGDPHKNSGSCLILANVPSTMDNQALLFEVEKRLYLIKLPTSNFTPHYKGIKSSQKRDRLLLYWKIAPFL